MIQKWFKMNHLLKSNQIKLQKQARLFLRGWPLTTWFRFPRDSSFSHLCLLFKSWKFETVHFHFKWIGTFFQNPLEIDPNPAVKNETIRLKDRPVSTYKFGDHHWAKMGGLRDRQIFSLKNDLFFCKIFDQSGRSSGVKVDGHSILFVIQTVLGRPLSCKKTASSKFSIKRPKLDFKKWYFEVQRPPTFHLFIWRS